MMIILFFCYLHFKLSIEIHPIKISKSVGKKKFGYHVNRTLKNIYLSRIWTIFIHVEILLVCIEFVLKYSQPTCWMAKYETSFYSLEIW